MFSTKCFRFFENKVLEIGKYFIVKFKIQK